MLDGEIFDFTGSGQDPVIGRGAPVRWGYAVDPATGVLPAEHTPCPVCGASCTDGTVGYRNSDGPEAVEAGHGGMWQRATCDACGASWAECYYLLGALVDEAPAESWEDMAALGIEPSKIGTGDVDAWVRRSEWTGFFRVADGSLLDVALGAVAAWDAYVSNPSVDIEGAVAALRAACSLFGEGPGMVKVRGATR